MNKLSEKQLLILTIGVAVLLTSGLGFLVWSDLSEIDREQQNIAQLREQIAGADVEIRKIPGREYQVIANREISEKETSILPEETEIEEFWEVLEQRAEEAQVRISEITTNNSTRAKAPRGKKKDKSAIDSVHQELSLKATTDEFLRFINMLENHDRIINVVDYSIGAGEGRGTDNKVRHEIKLTLATFTYSKTIANTIVSIPQYDQKKENPQVKKHLASIKVQEKESYQLRTSLGRRDPFVNVRRKVEETVNPNAGMERKTQEEILQMLVSTVRTLRTELDTEDVLRKNERLFLLAQQVKENRAAFGSLAQKIAETQRDALIIDRDLQEEFRDEVLNPFAEIKERIGKIEEEKPRITQRQAEEIRKRVAVLFDEREWKKVQEEVRSFRTLSKDGTWVEDDARQIAGEIIDFQRRANVIQDFDKRKVDITTILFSPNGVSVAIINDKQIAEGDSLDTDGRVIVVEIGENYVIFETEGVEIKRTK